MAGVLGCKDLIGLHDIRYGKPMPPTCQGSTRPDNAILSHHLISTLGHIQVLSDTWFATHAPVMFSLQLPKPDLFRQKIKLPESWVALDITAEELISETNTGAGQHNAITTGWIPPLCDQSLVFLDKNPNPIQTCPNMQCIACKQKTLNAFEII